MIKKDKTKQTVNPLHIAFMLQEAQRCSLQLVKTRSKRRTKAKTDPPVVHHAKPQEAEHNSSN